MVRHKPKILFLGLSHIGQVYSIFWSSKIGECSVFDFNKNNLNKFKNKKFTEEEPDLKKFKKLKKIKIIKDIRDIKKFDVIFFTYDTTLDVNNGKPNLSLIIKYLKKIYSIKFKKKIDFFITSQVYPGFTDNFINNNKNKNINTIYFVDTLKMGNSKQRFLYPKQLIFGANKDSTNIIKKLFVKFNCKKYIFKIKEAELIKMSINLYLFFSVSFSNVIDDFARRKKINFLKILNVLKNDPRIGKYSYIQPSLAISGGHLERDYFYFKKLSTNQYSSKILSSLMFFNIERKKVLENKLKKFKRMKILLIGASYKKNSFSITNSNFKKIFNKKIKLFDDQFELKSFPKKQIVKSTKDFNLFDVFIYNYSNKITKKSLKKVLINNTEKKLINLSSKDNSYFKNLNVENFFSSERELVI